MIDPDPYYPENPHAIETNNYHLMHSTTSSTTNPAIGERKLTPRQHCKASTLPLLDARHIRLDSLDYSGLNGTFGDCVAMNLKWWFDLLCCSSIHRYPLQHE